MWPHLKKLVGHIAFGFFIHLFVGLSHFFVPTVYLEPCMLGSLNFKWIPHRKIADPYCCCFLVMSLFGVMPI